MAEWLKATDCKSVLSRVRRFEPYSAHPDRRSFSAGGQTSNIPFKWDERS
jgi:hypothetical protein